MKTTIKNQDDIVFENRNKNYGAYFLRRSYNKNVTRALFFAVLFLLGIVSVPLIANYMNHSVKATIETTCTTTVLKYPVKKDIEDIKIPEQKNVEKVPAFKPIKVVNDTVDVKEGLTELIEGTKNETISESNDGGTLIVDENKDKGPIDFGVLDKPVLIPEVYPEFFGGEDAMYKWLSENIKYPQTAMETGIQGMVIVTFVVEKDGSISGVQLLKDIGGGCGDEALRVIKLMPKWREGRQYNKPVRVPYNLPIKFSLEQ